MENFEQEGVVSLWVFREEEDPADVEKNVLMDMCGVDYYDDDSTEGTSSNELRPLSYFLNQFSYSSSFIDAALKAAKRMGIMEAYGVIAQFDFAYDPSKVTKPISKDPLFIGYFDWHE